MEVGVSSASHSNKIGCYLDLEILVVYSSKHNHHGDGGLWEDPSISCLRPRSWISHVKKIMWILFPLGMRSFWRIFSLVLTRHTEAAPSSSSPATTPLVQALSVFWCIVEGPGRVFSFIFMDLIVCGYLL
jgi:hypothetical protein